jgi:uroporphyrinogen-III decarboxylase
MYYEVNGTLAVDKIIFTFLPSWWKGNYGITYGEKYVFDPDYRTEMFLFFDRTAAKRFPGINIGSKNPLPKVTQPDFNNTTTPALAGCEVFFPDDNFPWNKHLSLEQLEKLTIPKGKLARQFPYNEIIRQVRYLNHKYKQDVKPILPPRGVLNDAMLLQGSSFLEDYFCNPKAAKKLLDYTSSVLYAVIEENLEDIKLTDQVTVCNCTIMMISPDTYADNFLKYDQQVYKKAKDSGLDFGIHHCGVFDKYAPMYRKLEKINWLAIGWGSDIKLALDTFPEAKIQCLISPTFMAGSSRHQVKDKIKEILEISRGNWHRLILEVSDIEYGTADDNIYEVYECCKTAK